MLQINWNEVLAKMRKAKQIANIMAVFMFLLLCDFIFLASNWYSFLSRLQKHLIITHAMASSMYGWNSIARKVMPSMSTRRSDYRIMKNVLESCIMKETGAK